MSVNIDSTSRRVSNLTAPISMTFPITQIQVSANTAYMLLSSGSVYDYVRGF